MKKEKYISPAISIVKIGTTAILSGSENMNVDGTNTVTNDNQVFAPSFGGGDEDF